MAEALTIDPILVGVPKLKSAFAISTARPNAKTNTSEIVFFILLTFQKNFDRVRDCHGLLRRPRNDNSAPLYRIIFIPRKISLIGRHFDLSS